MDGWRTVEARLPGHEAPIVWAPDDQLPGDAVDPRHVHGFAGEIRHFVECARDGVAERWSVNTVAPKLATVLGAMAHA